MAFTTLPTSIIEAGDPVKQELFTTYVKDNLDDHEARLVAVEGGSAVSYPAFDWNVSGYYGQWVPFNNIGIIRIPFGLTILAVRLLIHTAGSSGSTEIDVKYKRAAGSWTTVFSTKPSVTSASGDYAISTNAVLSVEDLLAADLIRVDLTATQGGTPSGLSVFLEYQKT